MTNNLNQFGAQGMRYAFYALWDTGSPNYISGTDGALAATEDSGMGRLIGITDLAATTPEAPLITRTGDNGVLGTFISNPTDGPGGSTAFGSFPQLFDVAVTGRAIKAEGPHDISLSSNRCYDFSPVFVVVNSPAQSDEAGSIGEVGWEVEEYLYVFAQPLSVASKTQNTPHSYTHRLVFNERGLLPYGETISNANYGVTQAWKSDPYWSTHPVYYHTYVGDGQASQEFTLDYPPYAADGTALQIWEAGTKLVYTTDYTVSASTGVVSFADSHPANGAFAVAKVMFIPSC